MSSASASVLKEIEVAIESRNFGRMNEIGNKIIGLAKSDVQWLDATIVITGYLMKSSCHMWDAVNLSKQAAVMAPDKTELQQHAIKALTSSINAFPRVEDRVKAAHSVVVFAPKGSPVLVISINIMLDNTLGLTDAKERRRYTLVAVSYAPANSAIQLKAQSFLKREEVLAQRCANGNARKGIKAENNAVVKKKICPTEDVSEADRMAAEEMMGFIKKEK